MDGRQHCAECEQIVTQMRAAFLKRLTKGTPPVILPTHDDFVQFLSTLFVSDENVARLSKLWDQSEFRTIRHKWTEHRIATRHTPLPMTAHN